MTNPGNAIGTNAAYSGRTSVNAFNDILSALSRGVVSGWECKPSSGLTVELGGSGGVRDVAIAEDNAGNKTSINNISGSPVQVTLSAAPGANSRIDAIVAYVDSPTNGSADKADNPDVCGIIPVSGTVASSPSDPTDSQIRAAITSDGANGTSAYYAILATVKMNANLSNITNNEITSKLSYLAGKKVTSENVDWSNIPRIVTVGSYKQNLPANQGFDGVNYNVSIPTQPDTNYEVLFSIKTEHAFDLSVVYVSVSSKTTSSFTFNMRNGSSSSSHEVEVSYMVVRQG